MALPPEEAGLKFNDNLYIRLFKAAWVLIGPDWWNFHPTKSSFWRLYRNYAEGAQIEIGGNRVELSPSRLYLIPAGVNFVTRADQNVGQFYIHFDVIGLPHALVTDLFASAICLPDIQELMDLADRLCDDVRAGQPDLIKLQCRVSALIYLSLAGFFDNLSSVQKRRYAEQYLALRPVMPAILAIERRYSEHLSNNELSRLCFMSETYFIGRFKECVGTTPRQYLQAYRIRMAAQLLLFSNASIDQLADENGFASTSHFIRTFRRHTGLNPTEYRRDRPLW
jgi:AraC family transcriptional regulator of arabinose operon